MSDIQIFKNEHFGQIRIVSDAQGEPMFCLADVCNILDLTAKTVNQRLDDEVVSKYPIFDSLGREQIALFVNEDGLYDVILDSRKPEAKKFRKWVTSEVLPSIRKTGSYTMAAPKNYAEALRQLADTVEEKEKIQLQLTEKTEQLDESKEWYSIKRWAQMHRKNWRNYKWRVLKALSAELGYEVKKIFDANYEEVNIYHKNVFEAAYGK